MTWCVLQLGIAASALFSTLSASECPRRVHGKSNHDETTLLQVKSRISRRARPTEFSWVDSIGPTSIQFDQRLYMGCKAYLASYASNNEDVSLNGWTSKCTTKECSIINDRACVASPRQIMHTDMHALIEGLNFESLATGSRNGFWQGKALRVRAPVMSGFFTRAVFVMIAGTWAAANRLPFFVDMEEIDYKPDTGLGASSFDDTLNRIDAYFDPNAPGDRWEQYFQPPMLLTKGQVYNLIPKDRIVEWSPETAWWYFYKYSTSNGGQEGIYPQSWAASINQRQRRAQQVAAWVKPNDDMLNAAAQTWQQVINMAAAPPGSTAKPLLVLGVQMRGTKKAPAVAPSQYWPLIDAYIKFHEPSSSVRLFLATDDQSYLEQVLQRYGSRAFAQANVPRSTGLIWQEGNIHTAHRKGEATLIDSLLLSKCNFLLKSASAVGEFAIYFNPNLIFNSVDLSIADQPLPPWAKPDATAAPTTTISAGLSSVTTTAAPTTTTAAALSSVPPSSEAQAMDDAGTDFANAPEVSRHVAQSGSTAANNDHSEAMKSARNQSAPVSQSVPPRDVAVVRGVAHPIGVDQSGRPIGMQNGRLLPSRLDKSAQSHVVLDDSPATRATTITKPSLSKDHVHKYWQPPDHMDKTTGMLVP